MFQQFGKYLIIAGIILIIAGTVLWLGSKSNFPGNLPGDIKIKRDNFTFYAPVATMLIISAVLSLLLWIISKFK
ncbi:MAG: DUF2905 domain-containing protein [Bacteroidota bacterium]